MSGNNTFEVPSIRSPSSPITKTYLTLRIPENYFAGKLIGPCFYMILISAGRSHRVHRWCLLMSFLEKTSSTLLMTMLMLPLSQTQWSSKLLTSPSHAISNPLPLLTLLFRRQFKLYRMAPPYSLALPSLTGPLRMTTSTLRDKCMYH